MDAGASRAAPEIVRVFAVPREERGLWSGPIAELERIARYPLGEDTFQLDHGADYFRFFDRLGELSYYVAVDEGEVVAVGCAMLRTLAFGKETKRAWYVADLKVRPDRRGQHLPLRMFASAFPTEYPRCPRGYGISMNAPGRPNRVLRIARRTPLIPIDAATTLHLWSLDAAQMRRCLPVIREHRGETGFLSLAGVKDIVLASTGRPMPLWHVQFGPMAESVRAEPVEEGVHMLCAPEGDPLAVALGAPSATATVIAHRMEGYEWRNVLTSEI